MPLIEFAMDDGEVRHLFYFEIKLVSIFDFIQVTQEIFKLFLAVGSYNKNVVYGNATFHKANFRLAFIIAVLKTFALVVFSK